MDHENPEILQTPSERIHHLLRGWRFAALIITILLTAVGYLLFAFWGGWHDVLAACRKVGFLGIFVALLLSLANYLLRFIRWQYFLETLGHVIPWIPSFVIYMAGFSLTTTPGKAGEAMRSVFLHDYHVPYRRSFGAFIAERLSDLIAVILLAVGGLITYNEGLPIITGTIFIILLIFYLVQKDSLLLALEKFLKRILTPKIGHLAEFTIESIRAFRSCYQPKVLIYSLLLGVVAWGAEGLAFYYILSLLGTNVSLWTSLFIYGFSMVIGAITLLPGGLGGVELTMLQLLLLNGVQPADATVATLVIRITTLWFSVFLGLLALPSLLVKR